MVYSASLYRGWPETKLIIILSLQKKSSSRIMNTSESRSNAVSHPPSRMRRGISTVLFTIRYLLATIFIYALQPAAQWAAKYIFRRG
ncbi:hypothetical protein An10g00425 [Aspergillus niger]|uniref:Uncharacterized protein n=2 Tax=Aspergillus niger TaxID=5061 RepID=A2QUZ4_ASPNC|nr:hypothetical protein An10g00425 [Aspergillus niger]CAK49133.1 hypothetical protein An10g00425 [Aspergillus niger]